MATVSIFRADVAPQGWASNPLGLKDTVFITDPELGADEQGEALLMLHLDPNLCTQYSTFTFLSHHFYSENIQKGTPQLHQGVSAAEWWELHCVHEASPPASPLGSVGLHLCGPGGICQVALWKLKGRRKVGRGTF